MVTEVTQHLACTVRVMTSSIITRQSKREWLTHTPRVHPMKENFFQSCFRWKDFDLGRVPESDWVMLLQVSCRRSWGLGIIVSCFSLALDFSLQCCCCPHNSSASDSLNRDDHLNDQHHSSCASGLATTTQLGLHLNRYNYTAVVSSSASTKLTGKLRTVCDIRTALYAYTYSSISYTYGCTSVQQ